MDSGSSGMEPLACVTCRSRKLKCDRTKPACTRCHKLGGDCVYPESRRKPTFKRRNVKEIEARLAQVESYLQEATNKNAEDRRVGDKVHQAPAPAPAPDPLQDLPGATFSFSEFDTTSPESSSGNGGALMGLGYSEAVPPAHVQEELHNTFFLFSYHFVPIVHSGRYYSSFYGGPLRKPPMSLQYAIWALAAKNHAKYDEFAHVFYTRARKYIEADEMKGHGEHFITVAHAQALCLCAAFEAKSALYTRAATSCAKAVRACQMMGLDRLDGGRDDLPPALTPHASWDELEERRRVFWGTFAIDSHASITAGWPTLINTEDIMTRLPASEEAFAAGREEQAPFLDEVFGGASYSAFAGTLINCQVFRSILKHVHRCKPSDDPHDVAGGSFWKRHRALDNQLSKLLAFLPPRFRLPGSARDPSAVHINLNLHASVIILHHAALEKAEIHHLGNTVMETSLARLRAAAGEIANMIKVASHSANTFKSPLSALSLYSCTTVYVYLAKKDPVGGLTLSDKSNLERVIHAMETIGRNHEMTRTLLRQAYLDIERNGLTPVLKLPNLERYRDIFGGSPDLSVPLIARSSVSKHSKKTSVLPGRLPLNNPEGAISPDDFVNPGGLWPEEASRGGEASSNRFMSANCFQPVLGATTRNVAGVSPSVSPAFGILNGPIEGVADGTAAAAAAAAAVGFTGHASASVFGTNMQNALGDGDASSFVLPDRTSSTTTSSPANRVFHSGSGSLTGGTQTSTSLGLGNTPEENRIDLRAFQQRLSPMWQSVQMQSMQDSSMFATSTTEALLAMAGLDENAAPWEAWSGDATTAWRTDMP